jgi:hypothetical protein
MVCKEPVPPLNLTHCNKSIKDTEVVCHEAHCALARKKERKKGRKERKGRKKVGGPGIILLA